MNKVLNLFSDEYMLRYLRRRLLPLMPEFNDISAIRIIPYKKHVWSATFHVVVQFLVVFEGPSGRAEREIFCSAHSSEPRQRVLRSLNYLWDGGFSDEVLTIPRPLFFSHRFQGVFYEGLQGDNLHYYLYKRDFVVLRELLVLTARWFAKLHSFTLPEKPFNQANRRIKSVVPGKAHILEKIAEKHPEYLEFYQKAYEIFTAQEEKFFATKPRGWLIHGDAHPDNVIRTGEGRIGLIDFADLSVADFARDLGCFKQQLGYMAEKEGYNATEIKDLQDLFLNSYFNASGVVLDEPLEKRITLYYDWTAVRTLSYLLLSGFLEKSKEREDRIKELAGRVRLDLSL